MVRDNDWLFILPGEKKKKIRTERKHMEIILPHLLGIQARNMYKKLPVLKSLTGKKILTEKMH